MSKLKLSAQEGRALALTLIVLAVGCLLVPPFLAYISTNLLACRATEEGMKEQYASDAGVEYGIGKLAHDPSFLESMLTVGATSTLTLPTPVNNISPITVTVTNSGTEFRAGAGTFSSYVMWANSSTCTEWGIYIPANDCKFVGDIHTNSDMKIDANTAEMTGTLEYVSGYDVPAGMQFHSSEDNPKQVSVTPEPPIQLSIADYRPGGGRAIEAQADPEGNRYYEIEPCYGEDDCKEKLGVYRDGDRWRIPTGLYYVASGDIDFGEEGVGSNLTGTVTIVVEEGKIDVGGNDAYFSPYCSDNVLLFSNKQNAGCTEDVIKCTGHESYWEGIIYGLGGRIYVEGADKFVACLIGNTIHAEGAGSGIGSGGIGTNPPCVVFDITSAADDTTTTARIVLCSGKAYIVSWEIK